MIITIGKVNAVIIPEVKYAALFEKKSYNYFYQIYESTYDNLLTRVFRVARIFN